MFEYIFLVSSIIVVLLGILFVIHTLLIFHRQRKGTLPSGPQVDLKIFGTEIHGGRSFAIFVIGVLLIIFPLKYSVDILKPPPGPQPGPSIVPQPINFVEVAEAAEPTMKGFHVLKDIRVIDLRSRIPVPEDKKNEEYSPVTWSRYTLLRKLSADIEFVDFEFGTTGINVYPRCLTHEYTLRKVTGPHFHGKIKMKHTWQIRVDVKNIKTNEDFLVINEATYWNAFAGEEKEWAAMAVTEETDLIAMVILFPEDKPFNNYTLYAQPHKLQVVKPFRDPSILIPSENRQVFLWKIEKPKKGYTYQANWTW